MYCLEICNKKTVFQKTNLNLIICVIFYFGSTLFKALLTNFTKNLYLDVFVVSFRFFTFYESWGKIFEFRVSVNGRSKF
jgi:hypothetical protein